MEHISRKKDFQNNQMKKALGHGKQNKLNESNSNSSSASSTSVASVNINSNILVHPEQLFFYFEETFEKNCFKSTFPLSVVGTDDSSLVGFRIYQNQSASEHYEIEPTFGILQANDGRTIIMKTHPDVCELNRTVVARDVLTFKSILIERKYPFSEETLRKKWDEIDWENPSNIRVTHIKGTDISILDHTCQHLIPKLQMSSEDKKRIMKTLDRRLFNGVYLMKRLTKMHKIIPFNLFEIRRKRIKENQEKQRKVLFPTMFIVLVAVIVFFMFPSILHNPLPDAVPELSFIDKGILLFKVLLGHLT